MILPVVEGTEGGAVVMISTVVRWRADAEAKVTKPEPVPVVRAKMVLWLVGLDAFTLFAGREKMPEDMAVPLAVPTAVPIAVPIVVPTVLTFPTVPYTALFSIS